MDRRLRKWIRPLLANYYYLRKPMREVLPAILTVFTIVLVGGYCFYALYEKKELTFPNAVYITYCLIFMEHLEEFPDHWLLQLFYFVLPLLGLVVVLDAFTRFGFHIFRRDSQEEWEIAMAKTYNDHVIICGLGRVGLRTLQQLLKLEEEVVILERNAQNQNIPFAKTHNVPVLIGTGREDGILENLNVASAKSIILATDDDLANLEIALDARKIQPDIRVVIRMFDQELANKIHDSFDIHLAFSTAAHAAPLLATSSSDRSIKNAFYIGEMLMVVAHITVNENSQMCTKRIRDIGAEHDIFILSHTRDGEESRFPPASVEFLAGDELVIQTTPEMLRTVHRWNHDRNV